MKIIDEPAVWALFGWVFSSWILHLFCPQSLCTVCLHLYPVLLLQLCILWEPLTHLKIYIIWSIYLHWICVISETLSKTSKVIHRMTQTRNLNITHFVLIFWVSGIFYKLYKLDNLHFAAKFVYQFEFFDRQSTGSFNRIGSAFLQMAFKTFFSNFSTGCSLVQLSTLLLSVWVVG